MFVTWKSSRTLWETRDSGRLSLKQRQYETKRRFFGVFAVPAGGGLIEFTFPRHPPGGHRIIFMRLKYKFIDRSDQTVDARRKYEQGKYGQQGNSWNVLPFSLRDKYQRSYVHNRQHDEIEDIHGEEKTKDIADGIFPEEPESICKDDEWQHYLGI